MEKKEQRAVELNQVTFTGYLGPDERASCVRDERTRISWQGHVVVIERKGIEEPYVVPLHNVRQMRPLVNRG